MEKRFDSASSEVSRAEENNLRVLSGAVGWTALVFALTWVLFVRGNPSEATDRLLAAICGLTVLIFGLMALNRKHKFKYVSQISVVGLISALLGILIVENKAMSREHPMGFGLPVFAMTIALAPFLPRIVAWTTKSKGARFLLAPVTVFIIVSVGLAFTQWNGTLLESAHSEYVINEILARGVGHVPNQDFIPQYSYLLSWLFAPIVSAIDVDQSIQIITGVLSFGSIVCLILVLWLGKQAFPKLPFMFLVIAMIPFTTPTPGWNRISYSGPISTLLSGPSIRVLGGVLVGATLFLYISGFMKGVKGTRFGIFAGSIGSLVAWNNFDFGLASLVTSLSLLLIVCTTSKVNYWKFLKAYLLGVFFSTLALFAFLGALGDLPNLNFLGWFSRQFGGGFGSVTISVPGPVLLNFPLIFGVSTLGIYALIAVSRNQFSKEKVIVEAKLNPSILTAFFGLWSILCLPYYLNRSYQAGQMSIEYIGLSIAVVGSISLVYGAWQNSDRKFLVLRLIPSTILAFTISTIWLIPNPLMEWDRLNGKNSNGKIPRAPLENVISNLDTVKEFAQANNLTVAYYGESGNYIERKYQVPSANLFNNPLDMLQSESAVRTSCQHLLDNSFQLLVMSESGKATFAWQDGSLCEGLYTIVQSGEGVYLARIRS